MAGQSSHNHISNVAINFSVKGTEASMEHTRKMLDTFKTKWKEAAEARKEYTINNPDATVKNDPQLKRLDDLVKNSKRDFEELQKLYDMGYKDYQTFSKNLQRDAELGPRGLAPMVSTIKKMIRNTGDLVDKEGKPIKENIERLEFLTKALGIFTAQQDARQRGVVDDFTKSISRQGAAYVELRERITAFEKDGRSLALNPEHYKQMAQAMLEDKIAMHEVTGEFKQLSSASSAQDFQNNIRIWQQISQWAQRFGADISEDTHAMDMFNAMVQHFGDKNNFTLISSAERKQSVHTLEELGNSLKLTESQQQMLNVAVQNGKDIIADNKNTQSMAESYIRLGNNFENLGKIKDSVLQEEIDRWTKVKESTDRGTAAYDQATDALKKLNAEQLHRTQDDTQMQFGGGAEVAKRLLEQEKEANDLRIKERDRVNKELQDKDAEFAAAEGRRTAAKNKSAEESTAEGNLARATEAAQKQEQVVEGIRAKKSEIETIEGRQLEIEGKLQDIENARNARTTNVEELKRKAEEEAAQTNLKNAELRNTLTDKQYANEGRILAIENEIGDIERKNNTTYDEAVQKKNTAVEKNSEIEGSLKRLGEEEQKNNEYLASGNQIITEKQKMLAEAELRQRAASVSDEQFFGLDLSKVQLTKEQLEDFKAKGLELQATYQKRVEDGFLDGEELKVYRLNQDLKQTQEELDKVKAGAKTEASMGSFGQMFGNNVTEKATLTGIKALTEEGERVQAVKNEIESKAQLRMNLMQKYYDETETELNKWRLLKKRLDEEKTATAQQLDDNRKDVIELGKKYVERKMQELYDSASDVRAAVVTLRESGANWKKQMEGFNYVESGINGVNDRQLASVIKQGEEMAERAKAMGLPIDELTKKIEFFKSVLNDRQNFKLTGDLDAMWASMSRISDIGIEQFVAAMKKEMSTLDQTSERYQVLQGRIESINKLVTPIRSQDLFMDEKTGNSYSKISETGWWMSKADINLANQGIEKIRELQAEKKKLLSKSDDELYKSGKQELGQMLGKTSSILKLQQERKQLLDQAKEGGAMALMSKDDQVNVLNMSTYLESLNKYINEYKTNVKAGTEETTQLVAGLEAKISNIKDQLKQASGEGIFTDITRQLGTIDKQMAKMKETEIITTTKGNGVAELQQTWGTLMDILKRYHNAVEMNKSDKVFDELEKELDVVLPKFEKLADGIKEGTGVASADLNQMKTSFGYINETLEEGLNNDRESLKQFLGDIEDVNSAVRGMRNMGGTSTTTTVQHEDVAAMKEEWSALNENAKKYAETVKTGASDAVLAPMREALVNQANAFKQKWGEMTDASKNLDESIRNGVNTSIAKLISELERKPGFDLFEVLKTNLIGLDEQFNKLLADEDKARQNATAINLRDKLTEEFKPSKELKEFTNDLVNIPATIQRELFKLQNIDLSRTLEGFKKKRGEDDLTAYFRKITSEDLYKNNTQYKNMVDAQKKAFNELKKTAKETAEYYANVFKSVEYKTQPEFAKKIDAQLKKDKEVIGQAFQDFMSGVANGKAIDVKPLREKMLGVIKDIKTGLETLVKDPAIDDFKKRIEEIPVALRKITKGDVLEVKDPFVTLARNMEAFVGKYETLMGRNDEVSSEAEKFLGGIVGKLMPAIQKYREARAQVAEDGTIIKPEDTEAMRAAGVELKKYTTLLKEARTAYAGTGGTKFGDDEDVRNVKRSAELAVSTKTNIKTQTDSYTQGYVQQSLDKYQHIFDSFKYQVDTSFRVAVQQQMNADIQLIENKFKEYKDFLSEKHEGMDEAAINSKASALREEVKKAVEQSTANAQSLIEKNDMRTMQTVLEEVKGQQAVTTAVNDTTKAQEEQKLSAREIIELYNKQRELGLSGRSSEEIEQERKNLEQQKSINDQTIAASDAVINQIKEKQKTIEEIKARNVEIQGELDSIKDVKAAKVKEPKVSQATIDKENKEEEKLRTEYEKNKLTIEGLEKEYSTLDEAVEKHNKLVIAQQECERQLEDIRKQEYKEKGADDELLAKKEQLLNKQKELNTAIEQSNEWMQKLAQKSQQSGTASFAGMDLNEIKNHMAVIQDEMRRLFSNDGTLTSEAKARWNALNEQYQLAAHYLKAVGDAQNLANAKTNVGDLETMWKHRNTLDDAGIAKLISEYNQYIFTAEKAGESATKFKNRVEKLQEIQADRKENKSLEQMEKMFALFEKGELSDGSIKHLLTQYVQLSETWEANGKSAEQFKDKIEQLNAAVQGMNGNLKFEDARDILASPITHTTEEIQRAIKSMEQYAATQREAGNMLQWQLAQESIAAARKELELYDAENKKLLLEGQQEQNMKIASNPSAFSLQEVEGAMKSMQEYSKVAKMTAEEQSLFAEAINACKTRLDSFAADNKASVMLAQLGESYSEIKSLSTSALTEQIRFWTGVKNSAQSTEEQIKQATEALGKIGVFMSDTQAAKVLADPSKYGIDEIKMAIEAYKTLQQTVGDTTRYEVMERAIQRGNDRLLEFSNISKKYDDERKEAARIEEENNRKVADANKAKEVMASPLTHTTDEVNKAIKISEDEMRRLQAAGDESWKSIANEIANTKKVLEDFNNEAKKNNMEEQFNQGLGNLSDKALQEQLKYWQEMRDAVKDDVKAVEEYGAKVIAIKSQIQANTTASISNVLWSGRADYQAGDLKGAEAQKALAQMSANELKDMQANIQSLKENDNSGNETIIKAYIEDLKILDSQLAKTKDGYVSFEEAVRIAQVAGSKDSEGKSMNNQTVEQMDNARKALETYRDKVAQSNETLGEFAARNKGLVSPEEIAQFGEESKAVDFLKSKIALLANESDRMKTKGFGLSADDLKELEIAAVKGSKGFQELLDAGKLSKAQLEEYKKSLENELQVGTMLGEERTKMAAQLRDIDETLKAVDKTEKYHISTLESAADRLKNYVLIYVGFQQVMDQIRSTMSQNFEFSDAMADIQKVTGLADENVAKLSQDLQDLNTRSSQSELLKLAYQGGKMGVGAGEDEKSQSHDIARFTESAEMLNSALGEDFGGTAAITNMAKLTKVMQVQEKEGVDLNTALTKTGSAILELGNNSIASYNNIANFAQRLGSVARSANITMPELLSLGSTLDTMGTSGQLASTALTRLIAQLSSKPRDVAMALELDADAMERMVREGRTMQAITTVLDTLHEKGASLGEVAENLKDIMGTTGVRGLQTLQALAGGADTLHEHLQMANAAFEEGTAVEDAYLIKNNSAQANLERIVNALTETVVNSTVAEWFKDISGAIAHLLEDTDHLGVKLVGWITMIYVTIKNYATLEKAIIGSLFSKSFWTNTVFNASTWTGMFGKFKQGFQSSLQYIKSEWKFAHADMKKVGFMVWDSYRLKFQQVDMQMRTTMPVWSAMARGVSFAVEGIALALKSVGKALIIMAVMQAAFQAVTWIIEKTSNLIKSLFTSSNAALTEQEKMKQEMQDFKTSAFENIEKEMAKMKEEFKDARDEAIKLHAAMDALDEGAKKYGKSAEDAAASTQVQMGRMQQLREEMLKNGELTKEQVDLLENQEKAELALGNAMKKRAEDTPNATASMSQRDPELFKEMVAAEKHAQESTEALKFAEEDEKNVREERLKQGSRYYQMIKDFNGEYGTMIGYEIDATKAIMNEQEAYNELLEAMQLVTNQRKIDALEQQKAESESKANEVYGEELVTKRGKLTKALSGFSEDAPYVRKVLNEMIKEGQINTTEFDNDDLKKTLQAKVVAALQKALPNPNDAKDIWDAINANNVLRDYVDISSKRNAYVNEMCGLIDEEILGLKDENAKKIRAKVDEEIKAVKTARENYDNATKQKKSAAEIAKLRAEYNAAMTSITSLINANISLFSGQLLQDMQSIYNTYNTEMFNLQKQTGLLKFNNVKAATGTELTAGQKEVNSWVNKLGQVNNLVTTNEVKQNTLQQFENAVGRKFESIDKAIEWGTTYKEEVDKEMELRGLTRTGAWDDPSKNKDKNKKQYNRDESQAMIAELDRYYETIKTKYEGWLAQGLVKKEQYDKLVDDNEKEHQEKRSMLESFFTQQIYDMKTDTFRKMTKEESEEFKKWWDNMSKQGKLEAAKWKVVLNEWVAQKGMTKEQIKALDEAIKKNNLDAQKSLTASLQIVSKHMEEVNKVLEEYNPFLKLFNDTRASMFKLGALLTSDEMTGDPKKTADTLQKRTAFLFSWVNDAYTKDAKGLVADIKAAAQNDPEMNVWAALLEDDPNMAKAIVLKTRKLYEEIQDAVKKEAKDMQQNVDYFYNLEGNDGKSLKDRYEEQTAAIERTQHAMEKYNSTYNSGYLSENAVDKIALKALKSKLKMQQDYLDLLKTEANIRIANAKRAVEEADEVNKPRLQKQLEVEEKAYGQIVKEQNKTILDLETSISDKMDDMNSKMVKYIKSWGDYFNTAMTQAMEVWSAYRGFANTEKGGYTNSNYDQLAINRLEGDASDGNTIGRYIIVNNSGKESATASYQYMTGNEALQWEIDEDKRQKQQEQQAEAWQNMIDSFGEQFNSFVDDWITNLGDSLQQQELVTAENSNTTMLRTVNETLERAITAVDSNTDSSSNEGSDSSMASVGSTVTANETVINNYNGEKKTPIVEPGKLSTGVIDEPEHPYYNEVDNANKTINAGTVAVTSTTTNVDSGTTVETGNTAASAPAENTGSLYQPQVTESEHPYYDTIDTENIEAVTDAVNNGLTPALQGAASAAQGMGTAINTSLDGAATKAQTAGAAVTGALKTTGKQSDQTNAQMQSGSNRTLQIWLQACNLYSAAYSAMSNSNLSADQRWELFAVQAAGQAAMAALNASMSRATGEAGTGISRGTSEAWATGNPVTAAIITALVTAAIGAALGYATSKISASKSQIASITGASENASAGKLATGMLTYAKGKLPTYDDGNQDTNTLSSPSRYTVTGADGVDYSASFEKELQTKKYSGGAHFGIFSEKKPEIVIGGDDTATILSRYPYLYDGILAVHRGQDPRLSMDYGYIQQRVEGLSRIQKMSIAKSAFGRMPAFAEGNLDDISIDGSASGTGYSETEGETGMNTENGSMAATLTLMNQLLTSLVEDGITAGVEIGGKHGLDKQSAKYNRWKQRNGLK